MEIVYYVAASLDGFIATPDGGLEWLKRYEGGAEDYGYVEFYASVDCVILGRKTYEQCLGFLGAGIPLFDARAGQANLRLRDVKTYPSGIVQLRYLNP